MDGVISLPICAAGFFLIPDLPENTRAFYLTENVSHFVAHTETHTKKQKGSRDCEEKDGERWQGSTRQIRLVFPSPHLRYVPINVHYMQEMLIHDLLLGRWHVYLLTILYVIFINIGPSASVNPFSLWLKSQGVSISKIVGYPTCQTLRCMLIHRSEHHPYWQLSYSTRTHCLIRNHLRRNPAPRKNHVYQYITRRIRRAVSCHMEHPHWPQVVRFLLAESLGSLRPFEYVVGKRDLWS
jgi:hypothetical protein